jgi:hypothetical protein
VVNPVRGVTTADLRGGGGRGAGEWEELEGDEAAEVEAGAALAKMSLKDGDAKKAKGKKGK